MYRIGELAQIAQVSKRTIDYYTNLGLLAATRSDSNYRYYDKSALDTLRCIEKYKKLHMPLCEIKELLEKKQSNAQDDEFIVEQVEEITKHIHQLENELVFIKPLLEDLTEDQRRALRKDLSGQASTLIKTLVLFLA